jgi:hypothetical protein
MSIISDIKDAVLGTAHAVETDVIAVETAVETKIQTLEADAHGVVHLPTGTYSLLDSTSALTAKVLGSISVDTPKAPLVAAGAAPVVVEAITAHELSPALELAALTAHVVAHYEQK